MKAEIRLADGSGPVLRGACDLEGVVLSLRGSATPDAGQVTIAPEEIHLYAAGLRPSDGSPPGD